MFTLLVSTKGLLAVDHQPGFPVVTSYSIRPKSTDYDVYSVTQDQQGTLYFGADALFSFDGERWRETEIPANNGLYGLDFSPDGSRLWAAADNHPGWFERTPDRTWRFHSLATYLPNENDGPHPINSVFGTNDTAIYVATDRVHFWDGKTLVTWKMPAGFRLVGLRENGEVFVHNRERGLLRIDRSGPRPWIPQAQLGIGEASVFGLGKQGDDWLLLSSRGVLKFHEGKIEPFAPEVSELIRASGIVSWQRLPDGRYAIGTVRAGILFMTPEGGLDEIVSVPEGLPVPFVERLFVDRENCLWATSKTHATRISLDKNTRLFDGRARLAPLANIAIARGRNRLVVLSENGPQLLSEDERYFEPLKVAQPARTYSPSLLNGLVGTPQQIFAYGLHGCYELSAEEAKLLFSINYNIINATASRVTSGEFVISTFPGVGVYAVSSAGNRQLATGFERPVSSIAEDDADRLWLGTYGRGVLVIPRHPEGPPPRAQRAGREFGLPEDETRTFIRSTPDGGIVVFGERSAWFKGTHEPKFAPIVGYPGRNIIALSNFASDGTAWLAYSSTGSIGAAVAQVVVGEGSPRVIRHAVWNLDAVGPIQSIYAERDAEGHSVLWLGGFRGIVRHVVTGGPADPQPKPPLLNAFLRRKTDTELTPATVRVSNSTASMVFEFASPELSRRGTLELQTRIDGIDSDWGPAHVATRELTIGREGSYTFRVRAVAETGTASPETTFSFVVEPPWWRTLYAYLGALAVLGVSSLIIHRFRIRALRRRNQLLEEKVRERTAELAEASAAKTMFVANMSHDIRNPLNGIVGLALALDETRLDPKQREIVATLRECTTYLSSLVDDVLDFASIEAGRIELRPGPFVPSDLLNSVATTLKTQAQSLGATFSIETDPGLPPALVADAGRVQQILVNYVSNALKYAGGHIRLCAELPSGQSGEIEFAVLDEGPGISEADQAALFAKFSRLDDARRSHIPGTGVGLASCRLLADQMGGSVGVESQSGKGSRFYLRLPLMIAAEPAAPVLTEASLPPASVLLVEDTDYNAMAAGAVLRRLGLQSDRASSGAEALRLFAEKHYDIILLDRNLGDMEGTEVARRIRQSETDGMQCLILAVTAYCGAEERKECIEAGMDAFIGKPLTPTKLRKVLIAAGRRLLSSAAIETKEPAVDTSMLEYLSDGTEQGMASQTERFTAALRESFIELQSIREQAGTHAALADAAHRVLGQARMVGAIALSEVAQTLETSARAQDKARIDATFPRVAEEVEKLTAILRRRSSAPKA